ncbi:uncharacterized protein LOC110104706 [Dendrobium catenatum]|uniref:uncharacterized protein LOC110104706 n=1 Tax=Dendrobium catenatum TaxID=906689 RepID=UPI0009F33F30|nr:uncharacterized protein LOC110104706 [Dendrobium catenatum]
MKQQKGIEDSTHPNHICLLCKEIYGLKQAPRQWFTTFTNYLLSIGFQHSKADQSLLTFVKPLYNSIFLYMSTTLITGNNKTAIEDLLQQLNQRFTMKQLGLAHHFLGVKIQSAKDKYFLSQTSYAQSILQQANLSQCNSLDNLSCTKLPNQMSADVQMFEPHVYRKITKALQYMAITRSDIAYAVNILPQHMHYPNITHTYLLKRVLRYIHGTLDFGLPITKSSLQLRTFSDANWAGDPITRKSTLGYCSFLGDTLVSWTVKKKSTASRSSTESEYRALAAATANTIWIKWLLSDFGVNHATTIDLFCDNMSAIALANNPMFYARTKHIEIDQRFIRDHIQNNNIQLLPISTTDQIAGILTKLLSTPRFRILRNKLTITQESSVCGGLLDKK